MSNTVDRRIVEMQFENAQFEKATAESMSTLDKLKEKLQFSDSYKSIDKLGSTINNINLAPAASAVDSIGERFHILENTVAGVCYRIGEKLSDTITGIIKSFTIAPIMSGFTAYESELKNIQTIMATTGKDIDYVTTQMKNIAWYADETSYSYQGMVDNISKFTSQGIDLDKAASYMQGIGNLAGYAGASVNDATHAMEGFAKAMGAGKMNAQTWSWIQTAHMDTVQVKEAFLDAAVELGRLQKVGDGVWKTMKGETVTVANFRDQLKEGFVDRKVMQLAFADMSSFSDMLKVYQEELSKVKGEQVDVSTALVTFDTETAISNDEVKAYTKTMRRMGDATYTSEQALKDLTNWTKSASQIGYEQAQMYRTFGDAVEATKVAVVTAWKDMFSAMLGNATQAKELWTEVGTNLYEMFVTPMNELRDTIVEWSEKGGFDRISKIITGSLGEILRLLEPIRNAFKKLFPPATVESLNRFLDALIHFGQQLKLSDEALKGLETVLGYLEVPLSILKTAFLGIIYALRTFILFVKDAVDALLSFIGRFESFSDLVKGVAGIFTSFASVLSSKFTPAISSASGVLGKVSGFFQNIFSKIKELKILETIVGSLAVVFGGLAIGITKAFKAAYKFVTKINLASIPKTLKSVANSIKSSISKIDVSGTLKTIGSSISGAFGYISSTISGFVKNLKISDNVKNALKMVKNSVILFVKDVTESFKNLSFGDAVRKSFSSLLAFLTNIVNSVKSLFGYKINVKDGLVGATNTLIETGKKLEGGVLSKAKDVIYGFRDAIENTFFMKAYAATGETVDDRMHNFQYTVEETESVVTGKFTKIKESISNFAKSIYDFAKKIDISTILVGLVSETMTKVVLDINRTIVSIGTSISNAITNFGNIGKSISNIIDSFKNIGVSVKSFVDSATESLKTLTKSVKGYLNASAVRKVAIPIANAIIRIALAIGILAATLTALYYVVDDTTKFQQLTLTFGIFTGVALALITVMAVLAGLEKVSFGSISKSMRSLAACMLIAAVTLKIISGIDQKDLEHAVDVIEGLIVVIGAFSLIIGAVKAISAGVNGLAGAMLKISLAIDALIVPIIILGLLPLELLKKAGIALAGLYAIFGAFIGFVAWLTNNRVIDTSIANFAKTIGLFALAADLMIPAIASLTYIASKFGIKAMLKGEVAMGAMAGLFVGFGYALKLFGGIDVGALRKFTKSFGEFGIALIAISLPIKILGKMDPNGLQNGAAVVEKLSVILLGVGLLAGSFARKGRIVENIDSFGKAMQHFAVAMAVMVIPIRILGGMDPNVIVRGGVACSLLLGVFGIVARLVANGKEISKNIARFGLAMTEFAVSITLLMVPIYVLGHFQDSGVLVKGIAACGSILVIMGIVGRILANSKEISKNIVMFGKAMLLMSASVGIIAGILLLMQNMNWFRAIADAAALGIVMGNFALIFKTINMTTLSVKGITLAMVSIGLLEVSLLLIAHALKQLQDMNPVSALASAVALSGTLLAISLVFKILANSSKDALIGAAAVDIISVGLIGICYGLSMIAGYNWDSIIMGATALSLVVAVVSLAMAGLGMMGATVLIGAAAIDVVSAGLWVLSDALAKFATIDPTNFKEVMTVLADMGGRAGDIGLFALALAGLGVAGVVVAAALVVLAIGISSLAGSIALLSATSTAFQVFINTLTMLGPALTAAGQGILSFVTLVVESIIVVATAIPQILGIIIEGIGELGPIVGKAAGDLVFGFISGLLASIAENAGRLFGAGHEMAEHFIEGFEEGTSVGRVIKSVKDIVAGLFTGIKKNEGDAEESGKSFGGTFLRSFDETMGIASPATEMIKRAIFSILGFTKGTDDNLGLISESAESVGTTFLDGLTDRIDSVQDVGGRILSKIKDGIPWDNIGSLGSQIGNFLGNNIVVAAGASVTKAKLALIGSRLRTAMSDNAGYSWFASKQMTQEEEAIKESGDAVSNVLDDIKNGFDDFGDSAAGAGGKGSAAAKETQKSLEDLYKTYKFGEGAAKSFEKNYGDTLKKIDSTVDVTKVANYAIASLAEKLRETGDYSIDTTKSVIEQQEEMLQQLQESYNKTFNKIKDNITGVDIFSEFKDPSADEETGPAEGMIQTYLNRGEQWLDFLEEYEKDYEEAANKGLSSQMMEYLSGLGLSGKKMIEAVANASDEEVDKLQDLQNRLAELGDRGANDIMARWAGGMMDVENMTSEELNKIMNNINEGFANGIDPNAGDAPARNMALNMLTSLRSTLGIASPSKETHKDGEFVGIGFGNGILATISYVKDSVTSLCQSLTYTFRNNEISLYERAVKIGNYIVEGLASAIENGRSRVVNAAASMVSEAILTAEAIAQIDSPSKVFAWMGDIMDTGLANGITDNKKKVTTSAGVMMNDTVSELVDFLSRSIDINPVIRPTLDLSRVNAQVSSMGSMFDRNKIEIDNAKYGIFQNGSKLGDTAAASLTFTQNNYSPKALSRTEIYRQTKNQFAMMKEVVDSL